MLDLPPQHFQQPAIEYHQAAPLFKPCALSTAGISGISKRVGQKPPLEPERDLFLEYAKKIQLEFRGGFHWKDIAQIVADSSELVKEIEGADKQEEAVIKIIDNLIDITDTPYLPDRITDPLFKQMIRPFVSLAFQTLHEKISQKDLPSWELHFDKTDGLTHEDLEEFADTLVEFFTDQFRWQDLASMVSLSIQFTYSFGTMSAEAQKESVVEIINYVIDKTDTPYLPDGFVDPIFKELVLPFVDFLLKQMSVAHSLSELSTRYLAGCPFRRK